MRLFYQHLLEHTFPLREETSTGRKHSNVRITILFCCNMDGMDKRKILVIRKSNNPCCINKVTLSIGYWNNKEARMTSEIFVEWLENFDKATAK